jgi:hypothetical protein
MAVGLDARRNRNLGKARTTRVVPVASLVALPEDRGIPTRICVVVVPRREAPHVYGRSPELE